jgi:hypothetical protein
MQVVYALQDPRDNSIFYVGLTADLYTRYIQHIKCEGNNAEKNERISQLKALGLLPIPITLEVLHTLADGQRRELYWVEHYAYLRAPLTNELRPALVRRLNAKSTKKVVALVDRDLSDETTPEEHLQAKMLEVMEFYGANPDSNQTECMKAVWNAKPGDNEPWRLARREYALVQRMINALAMKGMSVEEGEA